MTTVRDRLLGWGGLLRQPAFRRLWLAQSVSQVGTQVTLLALPLAAILVLGASPLEVGVLGAIEFLPFLLFTLPAGVWVDRLPRRRILIAADLGRAGILAAVPAMYLLGWLAMWQLYVVAFAAGTLTVFFDVGYQAFLPELVGRDRLAEGNSRLEVTRSSAQVLGPGVAGVLVGLVTAPMAILADALSYLGSAAFLFRIRVSRPAAAARTTAALERPSFRREIGEGLRYFMRNPYLRATAAGVVTLNFAGQISGSIYLVFVVRELGLSPELIGLTVAVGSLGTVVGAATAEVIGRRLGIGRALIGAFVVSSASTFLIAIAPRDAAIPFLIASGLIQGPAVMVVNVNGVSIRQAVTPDHLLGRVNATGRWIAWGAIPLGAVIGGVLASTIGLRPTMAVGAFLGLFAVVWLIASPLRTLREIPRLPSTAGLDPVGTAESPPT
jgi:MFS family permease